MVTRFVGTGRTRQGGLPATHKQDFLAHVTGGDWRHTADNVDMNPPIPGLSATDVQDTLTQIYGAIFANGSGCISIGSVTGTLGDYNVGSMATPTLENAFTDAFLDARLINGGIIFVLAGKYVLTSTIIVPPGITIMGEMAGTIIVSEIVAVPQSMFEVSPSVLTTTIGGDSGGGELPLTAGAPLDSVRFINITLADNIDGNIIDGGGNPISTLTAVPMIACQVGAGLVCEEVKFIGRVDYGNPVPAGRLKTLEAIGTLGAGGTTTSLTVKRCFFDGVKIAINFSPNHGDIDYLVVDKCRARTFGTEDGTYTPAANCFITMTLCNAVCTNNYHVGYDGANNTVLACFDINPSGGTTDVNMLFVGNDGGPSYGLDAGLLINNTTSTSKQVVTGNNWGSNLQNEWFVVVGNITAGGGVGTGAGDFVGTDAIDRVLDANFAYPTTIIVNPGTYDVTSYLGGRNYNFIGNKIGNNYPVFNLKINAAAVDVLGNRYLQIGSYAKSIKFQSDILSTANYHSLHMAFGSNGGIEVDDCLFENVTLFVPVLGALATDLVTSIVVKNSQFFQTNDYNDNLSILLPPANSVILDNCIFRGCGYAGGIGNATGYASTARPIPSYEIRHCTMDLTGYGIDNDTPIVEFKNYFWIGGVNDSKVTIEDCQVYCDNTFTTHPVPINVGALSNIFSAFIYVLADTITIKNSTFNGPYQTYTPVATPYALPTLALNPLVDCNIDGVHVRGGALPLQISSTFSSTKTFARGHVNISNSSFSTFVSLALILADSFLTAVDIDILPAAGPKIGSINLNNNQFSSVGYTSAPIVNYEVKHANVTVPYSGKHGVVQIFSPYCDINVNNNHFESKIGEPNTGTPAHVSVLMINNINTNAGSVTYGNTIITGNLFFNIINSFTTHVATDSASVIWVKTNDLKISNNNIHMLNLAVVGGSLINCLYLDIVGTLPLGIVTNNSFARGVTILNGGYVYIPATSSSGQLVDNVFDSYLVDGAADTVLVSDNTAAADNWLITRNKNQTDIVELYGTTGLLCLGQLGVVEHVVLPPSDGSGTHSSYIQSIIGTAQMVWFYSDLNDSYTFIWSVPLFGVLPYGVTLISAEIQITPSVTAGTRTGNLEFRSNLDNESYPNANVSAPAGALLTGTAVGLYKATPENADHIHVGWLVNNAANVSLDVGSLFITYRW